MKEKVLSIILCIAGAAAVAYGMIRENNMVFGAGIVMVAGAYLIIRKRLKGST